MSDSVSAQDLHAPSNDPSTLNVAPGINLTDLQRKHVAIVLDLWQRGGTMAKFNDNFAEDVMYEDHFAYCHDREELVGQLIHIPTTTSDYKTEHYQVTSVKPSQTTTGSKRTVQADEILVDFKHNLIFKAPLPETAKTMHLDTTLVIFSSAEEGKIVRLQDRPKEELGDNSIINAIKKAQSVMTAKMLHQPENDKEDAEKVMKEQRGTGKAAV